MFLDIREKVGFLLGQGEDPNKAQSFILKVINILAREKKEGFLRGASANENYQRLVEEIVISLEKERVDFKKEKFFKGLKEREKTKWSKETWRGAKQHEIYHQHRGGI